MKETAQFVSADWQNEILSQSVPSVIPFRFFDGYCQRNESPVEPSHVSRG